MLHDLRLFLDPWLACGKGRGHLAGLLIRLLISTGLLALLLTLALLSLLLGLSLASLPLFTSLELILAALLVLPV
ncbi:hypothetical protein [Paludisphaera rhizosphaerae]|uniref:hypothetical protein n=1 Tax=Paludisphaera rhizosphaerae TaxID=2711216 RepID=UPI0013EBDF01|nr:hypothetical protein [Paludisphaera rhizosphaerae]